MATGCGEGTLQFTVIQHSQRHYKGHYGLQYDTTQPKGHYSLQYDTTQPRDTTIYSMIQCSQRDTTVYNMIQHSQRHYIFSKVSIFKGLLKETPKLNKGAFFHLQWCQTLSHDPQVSTYCSTDVFLLFHVLQRQRAGNEF